MSSDSLNTPPDEIARQVFAETRASTLIPKAPPTSGSETLVPAPEAPEPRVPGETVIAPEPQPENEPQSSDAITSETSAAPEPVASEIAPEPRPIEIEATQPQVTFDTAPALTIAPQPTENPALALTFVPAPDAPFQSSVTVGIRSHAAGAQIYYTLDGTMPDQTSTPYTPEKILLTQSATLSARAYIVDKSGPICSADYIVSKPLWQENEPADKTDETPHKLSENQSAPDSWQLAAASVRGKLHAHRALWREDSFSLGSAENAAGAWSILIVSDGAGSAPLSRVGSNIACQSALGDLMGTLGAIEAWNDDINADLPRIKAALVGAAKTALNAIRDEATKRNQPVAAFAATLLILVRRALGEAQLCAAIQVGDGAIALDCESGMKLLGAADHGQHSSETRFLTTQGMEDDFANRVKFSLPKDLRATLVVSDGVSDDYFPEDKRLNEVFEAVKPLCRNADDAGAALLEWLGYEKKGSSDDRTLVLSWPGEISAVDALGTELSQSETSIFKTETSMSKTGTSVSEMGTSILDSETSVSDSEVPVFDSEVPVLDSETSVSDSETSASETEVAHSETGTSSSTSASPAVADDAATAPAPMEMRDGT